MKIWKNYDLPAGRQVEEGYTKLCRFDELKEREGRRFIVDETEVAVFKINNVIYALSNICPHQHTSLIYDGFIEDDCVVCPVHGWKFNLKTGRQPKGQKGLDSFPIIIFEDNMYVKVYKKELNW
ncbi:MAG: nitrite reductase (NAD(P)H) small subunit [Ignavibacteria bacterium]|nr:nitrite reductase (NAD(P)H) small subunit [Ignavibacteria bacterium]